MNRRNFVQFCIGGASAGAVAAAGYSMARPLIIDRRPALPPVDYIGAERTGGPAPRGVPFIPIRLNDAGIFEGLPSIPAPDGDGEVSVLDWLRYCARGGAPGLVRGQDIPNQLRFFIAEDKIAMVSPWYEGKLGDPVRPRDFPDDEFGAGFQWRSEGQSGTNVLSGSIIRYPPDTIRHQLAAVTPPARPLSEGLFNWFMEHFVHTDPDTGSQYVAVFSVCTHFCCIPGYKEVRAIEEPRGAWGQFFCVCHNSIYEPRQPVEYTLFPERTEDDDEDDPFAAPEEAA